MNYTDPETIHDRELRWVMEDWKYPEPKPQKFFTAGDLAVGIVAIGMVVLFAFQQAYQYGYDVGREACRPPVKMDIKPKGYRI